MLKVDVGIENDYWVCVYHPQSFKLFSCWIWSKASEVSNYTISSGWILSKIYVVHRKLLFLLLFEVKICRIFHQNLPFSLYMFACIQCFLGAAVVSVCFLKIMESLYSREKENKKGRFMPIFYNDL